MASKNNNSPSPLLRVGLLGVAGISSKTALAILNAETGCEVRAVASRSKEKAEKFIDKLFLKESGVVALGYDDLIRSDLVDALYIPLPTAVKKEWVIKALNAGKHVVLEKPAALTADDYQEMLSAAYANKKFLLDGTMFPHHQRTSDVLECVVDESFSSSSSSSSSRGGVGTVDRIEANFTFLTDEVWQDENIRARKVDGDPHGCIGDLGWYCIRYALVVFDKLGSKVKSAQVVDCTLNKHGVPQETTCVVRFENNKVLWFHCSFQHAFRQRFEICGSKKSIVIDDLVLPKDGMTSYILKSSGLTEHALLTFDDFENVETNVGPVHEVLLWRKFGRVSKALDDTPSEAPIGESSWIGDSTLVEEGNELASISLTNQKVVDALMDSIEKGFSSVDIV